MAEIALSLLQKIRRIQFQATRLANDVLAGSYRSAFRGQGMEFEEVREYQPGDDVRTLDWNVTARMQRPYVKSFREERDMSVTLLVDLSASTLFGSGHHSKRDLIAEIAAVLAFSAIKNNDKVALLLFSDEVEKYFPPNKGSRHVLRLIRELLAYTPKHRQTNLAAALAFLGKVQMRSGICFLLSDFICNDYSHELGLISKRHDLVSIALVDPCERILPDMDLVTFQDLESQQMRVVDTAQLSLQQHLANTTQQRLAFHQKLMKKVGADFVVLNSEQPYLPQLHKFFTIRQKRMR